MRIVRYLFLCAVLAGLTVTLVEGSGPGRPVTTVAAVATAYGSNAPTGIGASIYPAQSLFIAGQGTSGPGIGLLVGLSIAGLVVLGAIGAVVFLLVRRG